MSDIDIAVYLDQNLDEDKRFEIRLELIGEAGNLLRTDKIDLVILNHEYLEIDFKKVHQHREEDLRDFDFYAKCVAQYIKSKGYKK